MASQKTINKVMDAVGINLKQMDLVEKILELESDNKRVRSVELHHGTMQCLNLWADVNLREKFRDFFEFKIYLASKKLPYEKAEKAVDGETYLLISEGVRIEFKKREFYP